MKNNEVMRLGFWGNSLATEVVLLRKLSGNEVKNNVRPFIKNPVEMYIWSANYFFAIDKIRF
ncbi:MAG: hypothetical protein LBQ28_01065 [Prevotellaceae bacterium]|jgi:hypothetical protein|nr:hypothetical protein [Prevotellaceae bacterium]